MEKNEAVLRYEAAAAVLPNRLRRRALAVSTEWKEQTEELRLRVGRALSLLLPEGEMDLPETVTGEDLEILCDFASEFSRYASMETLRQGFLPAKGGLRIGLCGTTVMKNGEPTNLKDISSAVIRIEREKKGIAVPLAEGLFQDGVFQSTLILSPPGGGKTTLLRDLVRTLSEEKAQRIARIGERSEVAVTYRGRPQMGSGAHTDVLDGCPKSIGIPMVLRAMNPQIIAVDEITVRQDLQAIAQAAGCGVALLATIHGQSVEELTQKPLYRELLEQRVFRNVIRISHDGAERSYRTEQLP